MELEFNPYGMSWPLIVSMVVTVGIAVFVPVLAIVVALRRLEGTMRHVALGIGTFVVFQVLTRIPLVVVGGLALQDTLVESESLQWMWLVALSFSAGLFEEGGRWVAYRWGFKSDDGAEVGSLAAEGLMLVIGIASLAWLVVSRRRGSFSARPQ